MQETKQCKKNETNLYMKNGTGASATAAADREAVTEQRMPANEIVFRDHQCKGKNIYKKNENIYAYICEEEEEERELKKLTLAQMECRCSRRR